MDTYLVHERVTSRGVIKQKQKTQVPLSTVTVQPVAVVYANHAYFARMNYWILTCRNIFRIAVQV
jgi:hypothetical protein